MSVGAKKRQEQMNDRQAVNRAYRQFRINGVGQNITKQRTQKNAEHAVDLLIRAERDVQHLVGHVTHAASLITLPRNVLAVTKERVAEVRMAVVEQAAVALPAVAAARSQRLDTSPLATSKRTIDNVDRRPSY